MSTNLGDANSIRNYEEPKSRQPDEFELAMAYDAACWAPFYRSELEVIAIEEAIDDVPLDAESLHWFQQHNADFHRERERLRAQMKRLRKRMREMGMI